MAVRPHAPLPDMTDVAQLALRLPWLFGVIVGARLGWIRRPVFVHLMIDDKFTRPFIDMLNDHLPRGRHVVFIDQRRRGRIPREWFIFDCTTLPPVVTRLIVCSFRNVSVAYLHGWFSYTWTEMILGSQALRRTTRWLIWGGDMYDDYRLPAAEIDRKVRAVRDLAGLLVLTPGDGERARCQYGFTGGIRTVTYTSPVNPDMLRSGRDRAAGRFVVQVNNSADPSSSEALEWLAKVLPPTAEVRVVHSYGDTDYTAEVEATGRRLFGDRFTALTEFLPPAKFAEFFAPTDVLVLNQRRQQGLGNVYMALTTGAAIFVRGDVSTFGYITGLGAYIYDTMRLSDATAEQFRQWVETPRPGNHRIGERLLSLAAIAEQWRTVFEQDSQEADTGVKLQGGADPMQAVASVRPE